MIGLIWAQTPHGSIGRDGTMPWHVTEDARHFAHITTGHTVVMGRKTWDSLPPRFRPLPDRHNVVVSRDPGLALAGATVVPTLSAALALAPEVWVMGGGQIYQQALPYADTVEVTQIEAPPEVDATADAWAPRLGEEWELRFGPWSKGVAGMNYRFGTATRRPGHPPLTPPRG